MAQGAVHPGESTPATAATPRTGLSSTDPARGRLPVTPRELGFTPFRDPPPPPSPQEGAMPNSPEGIRDPGLNFSKPVPENEDLTTPGSSLDSTSEALAREELLAEEQDAQLDAQILVSADLSQGKPPAKAAIHPVRDPSSQEGAPPNSLDEIQTPEWKPCAGCQAVPDTEDVRTPVSSLKSTCEALAHEAFTDEQHAQLYAHILITADLNQGKPPSKAAMVLAFGQPVEGEKHAWEEVWRAALDRYQSQMSPMGCETPFSSQNGPLEPSPNSMKNLEEFELKETHSELVDTQSSKRQNQKSPMTGFETPINSVIGNCTAQGLDVQNGGELQLAVSCADKVDQELPDDSKYLIKNVQTLLEPLSCSTPLESSESLTEQGSCVKCGKDGQLLKCRSCFLGAHASCLGSSVRFDETGHFDCPVCFCRKAAKALEKAKKTYSEARKNLSVFCSGWKQFTNEHIEQSTGKQQRAANFEDQMIDCRTAKKHGDHQSEAAELSRKGEEPSHLKGNGTSDASPEKVATTKTALCPISENAKSHVDGNSSLSRVVAYSPRDRFSSVANRNIGVGKENSFMNSPHCNFSDRLGAISTRNTSRRRVTFQEVGTVAPNSSWKTLKYQDQSVHSPARKRYYPYPPEYYYSPCTPAMRSPLVPSKTPFTSTTARRKMIFWTEAEEAALMEAVAKFAPKGEAANEKRAISWVRIHEYGKESFHPTRCPDDLRKKWNRMKNKLGCPETCPAPLGVVLGEREGK